MATNLFPTNKGLTNGMTLHSPENCPSIKDGLIPIGLINGLLCREATK